MSYVSFYRKWRPQTFSEIIGQEYVVKTLQNAISKNRTSHSYIFCGPKGTGKTSLARVFAKGLNCEKGPTSDPCNKCSNCLSIAAGTNVDVIEIDAASNRGIDDIRSLRERVRYLPLNLRKKVYIIDEAHQVTPEAFNAFLKVLEEPPEHVIFIMATTEPHKVLPTIMSRCQRFDFEPIPLDKIKKRLRDIAASENIEINDAAIGLIAKYADGSLRDADGILEQLSSFEDKKITVDDVTSLLGIIDQDLLFELANIFLEKNLTQSILFIQRIIASSFNLRVFTTEFLEHLYILYTIKNYDKPMDILDIGEEYKERYFNQAGLFSSAYIEYLIEIFTDLLKQLKWGESSKTFFKAAVIKAISFEFIEQDQINKKFKNIDVSLKKLEEKVLKRQEAEIFEGPPGFDKDMHKNKGLESFAGKKAGQKMPAAHDEEKKEIPESIKTGQGSGDKIRNLKPSEYEKIIYKNWDRLLARLRQQNISIQAMFLETVGFKLEPEGNRVLFFLGENKNWHKEHLSKTKNTALVQDVLKEVTGGNYQVAFEVINDLKELQITEVAPGFLQNPKSAENTDDKDNTRGSSSRAVKDDENEVDVLKYLEEKFEIKKE